MKPQDFSLIRLSLCAAAFGWVLAAPSAKAATILYYDSETTSSNLTRIASQTNASFVASSDATTSLGSAASFQSAHASQTQTVTLGGGTDKQYLFGTGAVSSTVADSLSNGIWLGVSFTAADDMTIDSLAAKVFSNSANSSSYAARDIAAFVRIGTSGAFTQFGTTYNFSAHSQLRSLNFVDTFNVAQNDVVQIRFAFTDRTRTSQDGQAATRVGSIGISAVPEPSAALLGGLGMIALIRRRRG